MLPSTCTHDDSMSSSRFARSIVRSEKPASFTCSQISREVRGPLAEKRPGTVPLLGLRTAPLLARQQVVRTVGHGPQPAQRRPRLRLHKLEGQRRLRRRQVVLDLRQHALAGFLHPLGHQPRRATHPYQSDRAQAAVKRRAAS